MKKLLNFKLLIFISILAISSALFIAGCEKKMEPGPEEVTEDMGPIKIGFAGPMSGDAAAYGEIIRNGIMMKVDEINEAGGINGRMVELVVGDELCDPKEAATIAQKFASDAEIVAVIGHVCSSATLAAIPYYKDAGLPAVSPTATNVDVCKKSDYMFRDVYRDDFQGEFLAKYAKEVLGLKTVGIFHENNDYAIGLMEAFKKGAEDVGLEVVGVESYVKDTVDFTPQLTKFKHLAPDGIFIAGYYQQGGLILNQAKKLGLTTQFMGADGLNNAKLIEIAGEEASEGFLASSPFVYEAAGGEALEFKKNFEKKYDGMTPDWMSANGYDAMGIIAKAIEECGADRAKIRDCLAGMDSEKKGYKGITGVTFFDENGDCLKPAYVTVIKGGEFVAAEKQMF